MSPFRYGHARHPDWQQAVEAVLAQMRTGPGAASPASTLGLVYVTESFGNRLSAIIELFRQRTGLPHWAGAVAAGVCATGAEYHDEPALVAMLAELPDDSFRLFEGRPPPQRLAIEDHAGDMAPFTALVHASPSTPELPEVIADLSQRIATGYLFGGIVGGADGMAAHYADRPAGPGLSGVLFADSVRLMSRVTQGCAPLGGEHVISDCMSHYIRSLDGQPALDVMLEDLGVEQPMRTSRDGEAILRSLPHERLRRGLLVGIAAQGTDRRAGFRDYLVRNLLGIDPHNRLLAVAAEPRRGEKVVFCTRDRQTARADLIRVCTELREELESEQHPARGALYFSCVARGLHLFGSPGAELDIIRHNLGDLPLIGMYANGEIARSHLYGHTGVLTLFV